MKILIVAQYFWPENFRINDLAQGLRERGHEVTVYTGKPNYPEGRFFPGYGFFGRSTEDYEGVRVIRVPLLPRGSGGAVRLVFNYFSFAFFASLLAPLRVPGDYDIIFVFEVSPITVGLPALVLKRLKRAPVLFWVQDLWPESLSATLAVRQPWVLRMVDRLVRFIYRHCDLVLVQSEAFTSYILEQDVPAEKIRYYPNSAEPVYQPVTLEAGAPERAQMPQGFRVMFAGNIGAGQDFETILDAAERLKNEKSIHWVIIGYGRVYDWVKAEIGRRGLGDTVHLLGRYPVEAMPRYFSLADVMLVTLRSEPIFRRTIPAKLQSYMACGRPMVAALDGEGARLVSESGAGPAVRAGDAAGLAEAVLTLSRMPAAEREAMGQRGREYFDRHFDRTLLLTRLEEWGRELAQAGKRAS
jgi:colanic acid biosynthesis glycosyl transferase WcaI